MPTDADLPADPVKVRIIGAVYVLGIVACVVGLLWVMS